MTAMRSGTFGLLTVALAVGCGSSSDGGSNIELGGAGGQASAGAGATLQFGGGGAKGGASGAGATAGNGSAAQAGAGGSSTSGGAGTNGSAGAAGAGSGMCPDRPQIYCNGACLKTVGETQGACTALLLETTQTSSVAVDDSHLYFCHGNISVDRMNLTTLATNELVKNLKFPRNFIVDGATLFFSTDWTAGATGADLFKGTLQRVPKAGGAATLLAQGVDRLNDLTLAAGTLYFTVGFPQRGLYSEPATGPSPVPYGGAVGAGLRSTLVDSGVAYYTGESAETVSATPLSDVSKATLLSTTPDARLHASDATYLYLTQQVAEKTQYARLKKSGGTPEPLATGPAQLQFKYRDGDNLYFVGASSATEEQLLGIPLGGGTFKVLATFELNQVNSVTASATHLYVGTDFNGIVRVKK